MIEDQFLYELIDIDHWTIDEHDARIAAEATAAERERLLELFSNRFRSAYLFFDDVKFDETIQAIREESLRQQGEP